MIAQTTKTRLVLICGGQSGEHEISLLSAYNVVKAINFEKYDCFILGIEKNGTWAYYPNTRDFLLNVGDAKKIQLNAAGAIPATIITTEKGPALIRLSDAHVIDLLDVAFPVLHGPFGEDGSIQGFFKLLSLPFVGSETLSSSMTMDKDITRRLLEAAGIPTVPFLSFEHAALKSIEFKSVTAKLGLPLFIKPANAGSSLGVSKVVSEDSFSASVTEAFRHDQKILIESAILGRELECAVLGNECPDASVIGEIIPRTGDFYSYEAKYLDSNGARLEAPAQLSPDQIKQIQALAIAAYKTLGCQGLARVDFFLSADDRLYVNEINTMPGFTDISMYPKLWGLSGVPYATLVEKLIQFALSRVRFVCPA
jgi:D-alanine-D-alanine ligase